MTTLHSHLQKFFANQKKALSLALIIVILYGAYIRINKQLSSEDPAILQLAEKITNEAWTFKNYSIPFHVTEEYQKELNQLPNTPNHKLYQIDKISPPSSPTITPQLNDEHGTATVLGLIWKITGDTNINWLLGLQVTLDILCIYLLFLIGQNFFNPFVGLLAAFYYARFETQAHFLTIIHTYQLTTICSIFILYIISQIYKHSPQTLKQTTPKLIGIGLIIGASIWFRSSSQILLPSTAILIMALNKKPLKSILQILTITLTTIIALSPLLVFSYQQTGELFFSRGVKWHTFIAGLSAAKSQYNIPSGDLDVKNLINSHSKKDLHFLGPYETTLKPYEIEAKKLYFEILKEDPQLIFRAFINRFIHARESQNGYPSRKFLFIAYCFLYAVILSYKKIKPLIGLFLYSFTYYFILSIIYFPDINYVFPIYPALFLITAHSIYFFTTSGLSFLEKSQSKKS